MARRESDYDLGDLKRGKVVQKANSTHGTPPGIVVCVGGVVLDEGRILLVRQAQGHTLEGQWTIPWGLIDPGETPEAAVLREIEEEAGVAAEIVGLLGIQSLPEPWEGWLGIVFQCKHVSGLPVSDGGRETDRARFFSLHELSSFDERIEIWCEWLAKSIFAGKPKVIAPEPFNPYSPKIAFL
jgi:ADP-ribose pyrophosphatase YjhB (NUDIX family)